MSAFRAASVCLVLVIACLVVGAAFGLGTAHLLLQFADGDARGAPFVLIGFAMFVGGGLGFAVGLWWAFRWLRKRFGTHIR